MAYRYRAAEGNAQFILSRHYLLASVLQTLAAREPLKSRRLWIVRYGSFLHRKKYTEQLAFGLASLSYAAADLRISRTTQNITTTTQRSPRTTRKCVKSCRGPYGRGGASGTVNAFRAR